MHDNGNDWTDIDIILDSLEQPWESIMEEVPVPFRNPHDVLRRAHACGDTKCWSTFLSDDGGVRLQRGANLGGNAGRTREIHGYWLGATQALQITCEFIRKVTAKVPNVALPRSAHEEARRSVRIARFPDV